MKSDGLTHLEAHRLQPKFVDEPGTIYNGMRPEARRRIAETELNRLIDCLSHSFERISDRKFVMRQFRRALKRIPSFYETEDRERMARCLVQIAGICGFGGHRALLTRWLFGPIVGSLILLFRREQKP